jgi:hypothetical protein
MRWVVAAGLVSVLFAGCAGSTEVVSTSAPVVPTTPLEEGKGGILGLLVNEIYRPVPGGLIFIERQGLTATTDASGQFGFTGLDPGTYILQANALNHEASPINVDVVAGEYTEVEFQSRRVFSEGGTIITTHYAVFVSCSFSAVVITAPRDCTGDTTGDSLRLGFESDYRPHGKNVTYLVTEMKANHKASAERGALKVVVRELGNGDYWASKFTLDSDYLKLTMRLGNVSTDDTENRNSKWNNNKEMETLLFPQGGLKQETQTVLDPTGMGESRGVGMQAGVKANFVQSLFLGEPEKPIEDYHVLSPSP